MTKPTAVAMQKKPGSGGRPSQAQAGQIDDKILRAASELFLTQGYGATSVEAIVKRAGISKRTFYHRYADKGILFGDVIHRLVEQLRPPAAEDANLFVGTDLRAILERLGNLILEAAMQRDALALHRIIISESGRFPELAGIIAANGARHEAVQRLATLLCNAMPARSQQDAVFAADQFMNLLLVGPQERALSTGAIMLPAERHRWSQQAVRLFLNGWQNAVSED